MSQRSAGVETILHRRDAIKNGILFAMGMALGKLDALKAEGGQLTCDLSQWHTVVFKYGKEQITINTREVFNSLKD